MTHVSLKEKLAYERLLKEKEARLARRDLFTFAQFIAPPGYLWSFHHALLYSMLNRFAHRQLKRLIIEMPPGHGKSEGVSRNLPPFAFGLDPSLRIIACSYTQDLAAEMNRDVQRIMDSPEYGQVFPALQLSSENVRFSVSGKARHNSDLFDIPGTRGYYKAAGVGVGIGGRRFDLGIIDDPIKDREEANSSAHRERVWRWFTSTFSTRQAKSAGICITSTRWHDDDLIGRIRRKMATGEIEPYEILTLPALATDKRHPDDPRKVGEALWPWFKSVAELEQMRLTEPRDFYALQQQDPRSEGGVEWGPECFPVTIWFDDWPPADDLTIVVISCDPSKGTKAKSGDYSAFVVLARSRDGTLWVEADLARRPIPRIVADGIELFRRVQQEQSRTLDGFGCEGDFFQELLASEFVRQTREQGFQIPIKLVNTEGVNKEVRIRRLSGDITRKNIRFRNTPGTRLLVRQLEEFPNAEHDDGPDALEQAKRLAAHLWNGRHKKR